MLGWKYEHHSLDQIGFIKQLSNSVSLEPREALYLATQLVNHGFSNARRFISQIQEAIPSKSIQAYLTRLKRRDQAIQALTSLRQFHEDSSTVREFYKTDGITFRPGTDRRDIAIVIFTTKFNNFTFSNLVVDAIFAELGVSRLFVRDTSEYVYLRGVKGLAESLCELPNALDRVLQDNGIRSPILTGYSSGGYASLYVATAMKHIGYTGYSITSDISPGTYLPKRPMYENVKDRVEHSQLKDLKPALVCEAASNYVLYYGQRDPSDRAHAEHLRSVPVVNVIPHEHAGHEVTAHLLEEGRFTESFIQHMKTVNNDV